MLSIGAFLELMHAELCDWVMTCHNTLYMWFLDMQEAQTINPGDSKKLHTLFSSANDSTKEHLRIPKSGLDKSKLIPSISCSWQCIDACSCAVPGHVTANLLTTAAPGSVWRFHVDLHLAQFLFQPKWGLLCRVSITPHPATVVQYKVLQKCIAKEKKWCDTWSSRLCSLGYKQHRWIVLGSWSILT